MCVCVCVTGKQIKTVCVFVCVRTRARWKVLILSRMAKESL